MGYDGSLKFDTKVNSSGFNNATKSMASNTKGLITSLKAVGAAIAGAFIIKGIMNTVQEAEKLQNAMTGLKSIMDGQGKSYSAATSFIKKYTEDGLIPQTEAITAYKNLALRGYDTSQIEKVMNALKDSATYGRQSSYTLGEAVQTASEGLKNENSILVDNAGVTKNVAQMWADYAKSIGTTSDKLTKQQKIQAEVNGILEETKFQTGDAITYADSYSGMIARLGASWITFKQIIGGAFMQVFQAILPAIQTVINYLIKLANVFAQVTSLIFGKQVKSNDNVAKSSNSAAKAISNQGNAAEKAGKQAENALLPFDKLNVLSEDTTSSSSGASAGGIDTSSLDTLGNTEIGNNVTISPKIKQAFDLIKNIYDGFINWVDINFMPIFDDIGKDLAPKIDTLKGIIKNIFSDIGTLGNR
jgi:predicted xylose isomerase-like sugar epimerase